MEAFILQCTGIVLNQGDAGVESGRIKESFARSERIGVIGSPSSTNELTIDILGTAVDKSLVGQFCAFQYTQDSRDNYALGQITEVRLRNLMLEDPTIRGLIRQRGQVDPVTERQDTHTAKMITSSVFSHSGGLFEPSQLGTVPSTGTSLSLLDGDMMGSFVKRYQKELFYIGKTYGSKIIPFPMWFKHFGGGEGGASEAYHVGVFGKTGSGKSWLSKMIMMGYATHPSMSILVLDPQGEYSKPLTGEFVDREGKNRNVEIFGLHNIALTDSPGFDMFKKILAKSDFFDSLGVISDDNKARAAHEAVKAIKRQRSATPSKISEFTAANEADKALKRKGMDEYSGTEKANYLNVYKEQYFKKFWDALPDDNVLKGIYTQKDLQERVRSNRHAASDSEYYKKWASIGKLFTLDGKEQAIQLTDLLKRVTDEESGSIVIIDLADTTVPEDMFWDESIKLMVINEILGKLKNEAEKAYREGRSLNTLVVADEAHRIAPNERVENMELQAVKRTLIDAVRTTRKYGLGWMFISQTLSSLDREIRSQIRVWLFGFGLGWGSEYFTLKDIIGGADEAIKLYQSFRDPQSTLSDFKQYPFMAVGPISPLSFSGTPLFFTALKYPDEFANANGRSSETWA